MRRRRMGRGVRCFARRLLLFFLCLFRLSVVYTIQSFPLHDRRECVGGCVGHTSWPDSEGHCDGNIKKPACVLLLRNHELLTDYTFTFCTPSFTPYLNHLALYPPPLYPSPPEMQGSWGRGGGVITPTICRQGDKAEQQQLGVMSIPNFQNRQRSNAKFGPFHSPCGVYHTGASLAAGSSLTSLSLSLTHTNLGTAFIGRLFFLSLSHTPLPTVY